MIVPRYWETLAHQIADYKGRARVFILGGVDTGKSYLCRYLIEELCKRGKSTALIDTDPGQSLVGPPATVAMALFRQEPEKGPHVQLFQRPDAIVNARPVSMGFVGAATPVGNFLQLLVGMKKLIDRAVHYKVSTIVINTSGLISGSSGRELKFQKIDLVDPTHLIALERTRELEYIVKNFSYRHSLSLIRLELAPQVRIKTPAERAEHRKRLFEQYFSDAQPVSLPLFTFGLHGRVPDLHYFTQWKDMVVGLCDAKNYALALARVKEFENQTLHCLTTLEDKKKIKSIQLSSLYLDI